MKNTKQSLTGSVDPEPWKDELMKEMWRFLELWFGSVGSHQHRWENNGWQTIEWGGCREVRREDAAAISAALWTNTDQTTSCCSNKQPEEHKHASQSARAQLDFFFFLRNTSLFNCFFFTVELSTKTHFFKICFSMSGIFLRNALPLRLPECFPY